MTYFTELEQIFQKLIWNHQGPHIATTIFRKKNKVGGIMLPNIKLYYKAIVIKTAWCWHKNRDTDQWNRLESSEINQHLCSQLIFNRGSKHMQWANTIYWINGVGHLLEYWTEMCRKIKLYHLLILHPSINSKWISLKRLKTKNPGRKQAVKSHTLFVAIFFLIYPPRQGKQKKK